MSAIPKFSDVVEAADKLSTEEQEELVEILLRSLADQRRARLAAEVAEARAEYGRGQARPASAADLVAIAESIALHTHGTVTPYRKQREPSSGGDTCRP